MHNHRRVGLVKALTDPDTNITGYNEYDTNWDTCCLGKTLSLLYTQKGRQMCTHKVRRMSLLEICLLFMGLELMIIQMVILTSRYSMSLSIMTHI